MLSKLYIIVAFVLAGVMASCYKGKPEHGDNAQFYEIVYIDYHYRIYCDRKTNIAYLVYRSGHRGSMTPYLNAIGQPTKCSEVQQ
jgi:hypothetical protein